jgi:membrane-bound lytic murein transglycosylase F
MSSQQDVSEQPEQKKQPIADIDFDKIKERGYLIALIDNSSTGLFLYKGKTLGYEYDLLKMFTDSLGVGLRLDVTTNLEEAFQKLNRGEGDILAYNLTVTKDRKKEIAFSHYHNLVRLVLVQKKPDNWRDMKIHEIERELIRNPVDLIGKKVHVRYRSSYVDRLKNLSDEIGGEIIIVEDFPNVETEEIIRKVAHGEVEYTVAEEDIAMVNAAYYPNIDVGTPVSFPQQIAWGLRKNADQLKDTLNHWIMEMRKRPEYYVVYDKYFRSSRSMKLRSQSEYSSIGGGKISPYDSLIKISADTLGWDWRLLAAQIFKESKFDPSSESWAGAIGLLQLLPKTAKQYGYSNLYDPASNLEAGTMHLLWLKSLWDEIIADPEESVKFILASYNVGQGHVFDARRLAKKYGDDPDNWEDVADYLLKKSNSAYYTDPVVAHGYCRGIEPVTYVKVIYDTFENYKSIYPEDSESDTLLITQNTGPQF